MVNRLQFMLTFGRRKAAKDKGVGIALLWQNTFPIRAASGTRKDHDGIPVHPDRRDRLDLSGQCEGVMHSRRQSGNGLHPLAGVFKISSFFRDGARRSARFGKPALIMRLGRGMLKTRASISLEELRRADAEANRDKPLLPHADRAGPRARGRTASSYPRLFWANPGRGKKGRSFVTVLLPKDRRCSQHPQNAPVGSVRALEPLDHIRDHLRSAVIHLLVDNPVPDVTSYDDHAIVIVTKLQEMLDHLR